jgi:hypothetical protein
VLAPTPGPYKVPDVLPQQLRGAPRAQPPLPGRPAAAVREVGPPLRQHLPYTRTLVIEELGEHEVLPVDPLVQGAYPRLSTVPAGNTEPRVNDDAEPCR